MLELAFYFGLGLGLIAGVVAGAWLYPREQVQRIRVDAQALARAITDQDGFTVRIDTDALAEALLRGRRVGPQERLH